MAYINTNVIFEALSLTGILEITLENVKVPVGVKLLSILTNCIELDSGNDLVIANWTAEIDTDTYGANHTAKLKEQLDREIKTTIAEFLTDSSVRYAEK